MLERDQPVVFNAERLTRNAGEDWVPLDCSPCVCAGAATRWEYHAEALVWAAVGCTGGKGEECHSGYPYQRAHLNDLGRQGWELVSMIEGANRRSVLYFKRPLLPSGQRTEAP